MQGKQNYFNGVGNKLTGHAGGVRGVLFWLLLLAVLSYSRSGSVVASTFSGGEPEGALLPLYVPIVLNGAGNPGLAATYDIAYVNEAGAWLSSLDGASRTSLTTDISYGVEEDIAVLLVAPGGDYIAIHQSDGWAIFDRGGTLIRDRVGRGFALTWGTAHDGQPVDHLYLSKIGHGIDRVSLADGQISPLVATSDDTNDHSPLWNEASTRLVFAHQEFGTNLYVTLVDPFDSSALPLSGENLAAGKDNATMRVIESVDSWHDQPISFHWAANGQKLVFAAKETIYIVDMATEDAVTIAPPGFGTRFTGRTVDVHHDRILYFAQDGLYVVGLDGMNAQRIIDGDDLHFPCWMNAGTQILYRGTDDRIYAANADGTNNVVVPHSVGVIQLVPLS